MTEKEAQLILLKAFVATNELPRDMAALLRKLIRQEEKKEKGERK